MVFTGEVITPSGKTGRPDVIDNKDGTVILKFDPFTKKRSTRLDCMENIELSLFF